jgi:hypothetical protein
VKFGRFDSDRTSDHSDSSVFIFDLRVRDRQAPKLKRQCLVSFLTNTYIHNLSTALEEMLGVVRIMESNKIAM